MPSKAFRSALYVFFILPIASVFFFVTSVASARRGVRRGAGRAPDCPSNAGDHLERCNKLKLVFSSNMSPTSSNVTSTKFPNNLHQKISHHSRKPLIDIIHIKSGQLDLQISGTQRRRKYFLYPTAALTTGGKKDANLSITQRTFYSNSNFLSTIPPFQLFT